MFETKWNLFAFALFFSFSFLPSLCVCAYVFERAAQLGQVIRAEWVNFLEWECDANATLLEADNLCVRAVQLAVRTVCQNESTGSVQCSLLAASAVKCCSNSAVQKQQSSERLLAPSSSLCDQWCAVIDISLSHVKVWMVSENLIRSW